MNKPYRDNVCAVIRRKTDNSVCIFHRLGYPQHSGWQFPQGGIDTSADLIDELKRELREEIGTDEVEVIKISPNTYTYDFPESYSPKHKKYRGQKQRWVLVELNTAEENISVEGEHPEFDGYQWVTPYQASELVIEFKKEVYKKALFDLGLISGRSE